MLHVGGNIVAGIPVEVARKRVKRVSIRVDAEGRVSVSLPKWWATLRDAERFLTEKWDWVVKTREKALANPPSRRPVPAPPDVARLADTLSRLHPQWLTAIDESGVKWKIRRMKTLWGSCQWRKRIVTYNADLAFKPEELVEYVVVHELTHLAVHDHGPRFKALMDARLPDWRELRRRLNGR